MSRRSDAMRLSLLLLVVYATGVATAAEQKVERPNIVLILCDDLGYSDLGSYGAVEVETPRLDRLAREGLRFTRFYNCAKCSQTRASLLSGLYWQQTRLLRRDNHVTLAEALQPAGYRTLAVGKWHVGRWGGPEKATDTPTERGFDRYFGFLNGAINYFTGVGTGGQEETWRLDGEVYEVPEEGFYATDAFTDSAVRFVEEAAGKEEPFFLYLAYNAPHYPLQAPELTVEKYRRRFMDGWEALRQRRLRRQEELGMVRQSWELSPPNATAAPQYPRIPSWEDLSMERQWSEDLKMAVYAAMVERMDRGIGRLMDKLETLGVGDDTLVMFLSDNGGCPFPKTRTPDVPPGPADSFHNYDTPWANLSNTPFRGYKRQALEGGAATPLIVRWPAVVEDGRKTDQVGHVIDVMPTVVEVAGAEYPSRHDGHGVLPVEGRSLVPIFEGDRREGHEALYWEYARHAAVQKDDWKLVARRGQPWALHDLREDRSEMHDRSDERTELAERLETMYGQWARRVGARFPRKTGAR